MYKGVRVIISMMGVRNVIVIIKHRCKKTRAGFLVHQ